MGSYLAGLEHEAVARIDLFFGIRIDKVVAMGRSLDAGDGRHMTLLHTHAGTNLGREEEWGGGGGGRDRGKGKQKTYQR